VIERREIAGLPAYWMPDARRPSAALQFRVGRSDETFVQMGTTHLVEHLSFFALGRREHANGFVDHIRTVFAVHGDADEIAEVLNGLAGALQRLPLERLGDEARILRAEATRRSPSIWQELAWLRYGAQRHGLLHLPEFALSRASEPEVAAWATEWFASANAAIWIAGPIPDGLDVKIPLGSRHPVPPTAPIPETTFPCWAPSRIPGIALGLVIPREFAPGIGLRIVVKRLEQRLRYEMGRSYEISNLYVPLDATHGHSSLFASCLEGDAADVAAAFLDVLDEFADGGPTDAEMEDDRDGYRRFLKDPDVGYAELDRAVHSELLGFPYQTAAELVAEHDGVTADAVRDAFRTALDDALMLGHGESRPKPRSARTWRDYPMWSATSVGGRRFEAAGRRFPWSKRTQQLVVGSEGVTWLNDQGRPATVRYEDCVGMLVATDGGRWLYGRDGFRVIVKASEWKRGGAAVAAVDAAIPSDLVIRLRD